MADLTLKQVRNLETWPADESIKTALRMLRERMEKEVPYYRGQHADVFRRDGGSWIANAIDQQTAQRIADALNAFEAQP